MLRRSLAVLSLSSLCLLGACVLADEFPESTETTEHDPKALLEEQLPSQWAAIATTSSVPDAGFVVLLQFHEGGTQTLDFGWGKIEGTWLITDTNEVELKYTGAPDQENVLAEPTTINDELIDLFVEIELTDRGGKTQLTFRRTDGARINPKDLYGKWRTPPLTDGGVRLGTEFDEVSYYGTYGALNKKRYFKGSLRTFPCGSGRDCWALTDSEFAQGVEDDGRDVSGNPAPNIGGTIRLDEGEVSGVYLPVIEDTGVTNQLLASPAVLPE